jgi:hypothetical protein
MLTLLANNHMPKSAMWGERAMLDWPLTIALHWPTVEVPKLRYIEPDPIQWTPRSAMSVIHGRPVRSLATNQEPAVGG